MAELNVEHLLKENRRLQQEIDTCWSCPLDSVRHGQKFSWKQKNACQSKHFRNIENLDNVSHDFTHAQKSEYRQFRERKTDWQRRKIKELQPCKFCKEIHIWGKQNCTAYGNKCKNCWNMNHSEKACTNKKKRNLRMSKSSPVWCGRRAAGDENKDHTDAKTSDTIKSESDKEDIVESELPQMGLLDEEVHDECKDEIKEKVNTVYQQQNCEMQTMTESDEARFERICQKYQTSGLKDMEEFEFMETYKKKKWEILRAELEKKAEDKKKMKRNQKKRK